MANDREETVNGVPDLDLFGEEASGLVLTDEQLLAIHGGSCIAHHPSPPPLAPNPY